MKSKPLRLISMIVEFFCFLITLPFTIIGKLLDIADTATK